MSDRRKPDVVDRQTGQPVDRPTDQSTNRSTGTNSGVGDDIFFHFDIFHVSLVWSP